ncbi:hypothetical protein [Xanthomonas cerealis]|uniref:hypothetical protein n=1 Tax=Xanthomonas cerealis TaxID=3390025 RepID=UPI000ACE8201|nr:hypothetical protein [Xanthomonas translucens]UKE47051.1 hypothetical protein KHA79_18750 [Xanthomonas translucens pv. cerealis]
MKICHRYNFVWTAEREKTLDGLDLKIKIVPIPGGGSSAIGEIAEINADWPKVHALVMQWDASDFVTTEFTAEEISSAPYCVLTPEFMHGYPQPEANFGYRERTYETRDFCPQCGIGLKQKAPFVMRKDPKWGKNSMMQLNWVFDEFFVKSDVWEAIFAPLHLKSREVLDTKGLVLHDVVQLLATEQVPLAIGEVSAKKCRQCGRKKHAVIKRGFFPEPLIAPTSPVSRSVDYFGSDHQAFNKIIVNAKVAAVISEAKLRGVSLWPCSGANSGA